VARETAASYHYFLLRASNYKAGTVAAPQKKRKSSSRKGLVGLMRSAILAASQNRWMREQASHYWFVRRTAARFMPGETLKDALAAAAQLKLHGIGTLFTHLGENIVDAGEAEAGTCHYLDALDQIRARGLDTELSIKLSQLGVDLSSAQCYAKLIRILERAGGASIVWIDMESSRHTDITLELYRRARKTHSNVGVCLQAYLHRTARDLAALMPLAPAIRLVKGAYKEPPGIVFRRKKDVDENFFSLVKTLLGEPARRAGVRAAIATHDCELIRRSTEFAASAHVQPDQFEFQMLYGIQHPELVRLVRDGYRARVLIAYGPYWFPWFMRRLAERPANVLFMLRHLFAA
jgi:proline dehydrogenase